MAQVPRVARVARVPRMHGRPGCHGRPARPGRLGRLDALDTLVVPPGTWAVFENSGPFPEALQFLWRDVFTQWFPSNPYQSRPGPEILRTRLSEDASGTSRAEAELWIPVERVRETGSGA